MENIYKLAETRNKIKLQKMEKLRRNSWKRLKVQGNSLKWKKMLIWEGKEIAK